MAKDLWAKGKSVRGFRETLCLGKTASLVFYLSWKSTCLASWCSIYTSQNISLKSSSNIENILNANFPIYFHWNQESMPSVNNRSWGWSHGLIIKESSSHWAIRNTLKFLYISLWKMEGVGLSASPKDVCIILMGHCYFKRWLYILSNFVKRTLYEMCYTCRSWRNKIGQNFTCLECWHSP